MNYKSIFSLSPGRCRIVYMDEVKVGGLTVNDMTFLKEKVYRLMEEKLLHYNAAWIS